MRAEGRWEQGHGVGGEECGILEVEFAERAGAQGYGRDRSSLCHGPPRTKGHVPGTLEDAVLDHFCAQHGQGRP